MNKGYSIFVFECVTNASHAHCSVQSRNVENHEYIWPWFFVCHCKITPQTVQCQCIYANMSMHDVVRISVFFWCELVLSTSIFVCVSAFLAKNQKSPVIYSFSNHNCGLMSRFVFCFCYLCIIIVIVVSLLLWIVYILRWCSGFFLSSMCHSSWFFFLSF